MEILFVGKSDCTVYYCAVLLTDATQVIITLPAVAGKDSTTVPHSAPFAPAMTVKSNVTGAPLGTIIIFMVKLREGSR